MHKTDNSLRTCVIVQGTLLNALYLPIWEKNFLKMSICITDSFCYTLETNTAL